MKRFPAVVLAVALGCSTPLSPAAMKRVASVDERTQGDAMARKMVDSLGGQRAFQKLRHIGFTFVLKAAVRERTRRTHAWDPHTQLARITHNAGGKLIDVVLRVPSRRGRAWIDGVEVKDPGELTQRIATAHAQWVNDTYWLCAPFKVFDPGARRAWMDGRLRISFEEDVGLTPGDVYFYELAPSGRPEVWGFILQNGTPGRFELGDPVVFEGVTFFRRRAMGPLVASFESLVASSGPDPELAALLPR